MNSATRIDEPPADWRQPSGVVKVRPAARTAAARIEMMCMRRIVAKKTKGRSGLSAVLPFAVLRVRRTSRAISE